MKFGLVGSMQWPEENELKEVRNLKVNAEKVEAYV